MFSVSAFLKTIFAFLEMILEGKFIFSKNMPQYKFTLLFELENIFEKKFMLSHLNIDNFVKKVTVGVLLTAPEGQS